MNRTLRTLIVPALVLGSLVAACGPDGTSLPRAARQERLKSFMLSGRRVQQSSAREGSFLNLTGAAAVVASDEESATGAPAWLQFDTRLMPDASEVGLVQDATARLGETFVHLQDVDKEARLVGEGVRDLGEGVYAVSFTRVVTLGATELPVRDSYADFIYARQDDGSLRLREIRARHFGALNVEGAQGLAIGEADALAALGETDWRIVGSEELIYPIERARDEIRYVRATAVHVQVPANGEEITATIANVADATGEREVLEGYSHRVYAEAPVLSTLVYPRSYRDQRAAQGLSFARVTQANATTNALGEYPAQDFANASVVLNGPRGRVVRGGGNWTVTANLTKAGTQIDPANDDLRAMNVFMSVQRVNNFVRRHYVTTDLTYLANPVAVTINNPDNCNAFYTNSTLTFFSEGKGCANTAMISDVIYHEWGHGLDDFTGRQKGITDGAFSEGIGDILAAYFVNDFNMGVGFFLANNTPVRTMQHTLAFPKDRGEVHAEGQIIGGAFWDMRVALVKRYGAIKGAYLAEKYFLRHLLNTDSYQESYAAVILLDDDDANPATRSPNFCLISEAFAKHGLANLPADCTDAPKPEAVPVDAQLAVGVLSSGADGVRLMASSTDADVLWLCLGDSAKCIAGGKTTWTKLTVEGKNAERKFFVTDKGMTLKEGDFVTIVKTSNEDVPVGKRTIKFASR